MEKDKTLYVCLRCKYSCSNKFNFKKHLLKKNVCDSLYRDFDVFFLIDKLDEGDYISFYKKCIKQTKCDYCSSFFSSKSNMIRHRNVCPNNPKNLKEILNLVKKSDNNDTQLEKSACVESGAQIQIIFTERMICIIYQKELKITLIIIILYLIRYIIIRKIKISKL